jgi:hypothetical protein
MKVSLRENKKLSWIFRDGDQHWLFERNGEIHQIVDFIFERDQ